MSSAKQRPTLPRRTEEFEYSAPQSVKKPAAQRQSRIAQPVRKLSKASFGYGLTENRRSASTDRLTGGPSSAGFPQQTPSTARKLRTTDKGVPALTPSKRTPLKSSENGIIPSTIEKDKAPLDNRDWMAGQCERVCDYLETISELPRDFVDRRNLKAMSMKQFLLIMSHLFRQIGGTRYKLGNNFIDDIMNTMTELEYPYTVNKSMLKTPNVPHSINHIIVMIGWLIQLAPAIDRKPPQLQRAVGQLDEFPSHEYQEFFFEKAQEGFNLWNLKQEEEFDKVVEILTDRLVMARTDGLNQQQVRERIDQLEQELAEIDNRSIHQGREQSMDGLVRAIQEQEQIESKLAAEVNKLRKQANKAEEEYYLRQEDYYSRVKELEQLKKEVKNQRLDAAERDELMNAIAANKSLLTAKRLAVSTLEQTSFDHQIALSRLIKQKFNLITTLNTKLHQYADALKPLIKFKAPTIDLKTERYADLLTELHSVQDQLQAVTDKQATSYSTLSEQKSLLEHDLADLQIKHASVEKALQEANTRYEHLQQQREALIAELSALNVENSQAAQRAQDDQLQKDREIEQLRERCDQNWKALEKLNRDKQKIMHEKLEECQRMLRGKKEFLAQKVAQVEVSEGVIASVLRDLGPEGED